MTSFAEAALPEAIPQFHVVKNVIPGEPSLQIAGHPGSL
jgi:hypothetical protein